MKSLTSIHVRGCYPNAVVTLSSSNRTHHPRTTHHPKVQPAESHRPTSLSSRRSRTEGPKPVLPHTVPARSFVTTTAAHVDQQKPLNAVSEATLNMIRDISPKMAKYVIEDPEQKGDLVLRIPSETSNHLFSTEGREFLEVRCQFNKMHKWHELAIRWPVTNQKKVIAEDELRIEQVQLVEPDGAPGEADLTESVKRAVSVIEALVSEKTKPYGVESQSRVGAPIKVHGKSYSVTVDPASVDTIISSKIMDAKEKVEIRSIPPKHAVVVRSWKGHYDEIAFPNNAHEIDDEWGKSISIE